MEARNKTQCFGNECREEAKFVVVVEEERLKPLCEVHILEEMCRPRISIIFPASAFFFASQMPRINTSDINSFLQAMDILKTIESAQELFCVSTRPSQASSYSQATDTSADLVFVKLTLQQFEKEMKTLPIAQWDQANFILNHANLFKRYVPVLIPSGHSQPISSYVEEVSKQCKGISSLMDVLAAIKTIEGPAGYYENRAILLAFDAISSLFDTFSRQNSSFYTYDRSRRLPISEIIQELFHDEVRRMKEQIKVSENVPVCEIFYQEIEKIAVKLCEISFLAANSKAASAAFLLKGDCHQRLNELKQAEEAYSLSLGSSTNAENSDLKVLTQARVRLALVYVEAKNFGFAWDHFREAKQPLEDTLDPVELAEVHIGLARLETQSSSYSKALEHLAAAQSTINQASIPGLPSFSSQIHLFSGQVHLQLNRYLAAVDHLHHAIPLLTSENRLEQARDACISLASALEALGRVEESQSCLQTALEGMPSTHPLYAELQARVAEGNSHS